MAAFARSMDELLVQSVPSPGTSTTIMAVLTSAQCRQARTLLGWKMRDLRAKALVSIDAISRLERDEGDLRARTLRDLRAAFEAAGIRFEKGKASLPRK
jgi:transcriptional regulator with XRE-family HTH domain